LVFRASCNFIKIQVPEALAGYAGCFVSATGYLGFFIFIANLGLSGLVLVFWSGMLAPVDDERAAQAARGSKPEITCPTDFLFSV